MTAKEVAEYLTNECNPDAIVLMDVEASALYEEVSSIGEFSPTQREFLNTTHAQRWIAWRGYAGMCDPDHRESCSVSMNHSPQSYPSPACGG